MTGRWRVALIPGLAAAVGPCGNRVGRPGSRDHVRDAEQQSEYVRIGEGGAGYYRPQ